MSRLTKRTIASRTNRARSRGPNSAEGKLRSSPNALRHGLLAKCIVLANESEDTFNALLRQHLAKLSPADDVEYAAIEEMAAATWRLRRLWAIETDLLDQAIAKSSQPAEQTRISAAFSQLASGPELHLLDRYESRLHRMYQRALHNLVLLREFDGENPEIPNEPRSEQTLLNDGDGCQHSDA